MKKYIFFILFCISNLIFADFATDMQQLDSLIQKQEYSKAIEFGKKIMQTNISDDEKKSVEVIIKEIELKKEPANIKTNIGDVVEEINTDTGLSAENDGTLPVLTSETISDRKKFEEYGEYEKKVVSTNNSEAIYNLAKLYIKDGLYERAMNLALKDRHKDIRNIYIAATSARMLGYYDKSIKLYKQVLSNNPNHAKSLLGTAVAYKGKNDIKQALKYMTSYSKYDNSNEIMNDIYLMQEALSNSSR